MVLNFPDSAPPSPPGGTTLRTDEQKAADLEALTAEHRQRSPKSNSYRGLKRKGSKWEACYRRVYLGRHGSEEEAALVHDQALLLHLGRCVWDPSPPGQAGWVGGEGTHASSLTSPTRSGVDAQGGRTEAGQHSRQAALPASCLGHRQVPRCPRQALGAAVGCCGRSMHLVLGG